MSRPAPDLLLISPELPPRDVGGIGAWAADLAAALDEEGAPCLLAAPGRRGPLPPGVVPLVGRSWGRHGALWAGIGAARLRGRCAPGAALLLGTWALAPLAARLWPGPVLVACHGSELTALAAAPPALRALDDRVCFLPVSAYLEGELRRLGLRAPAVRLPMALAPRPPARPGGRALVVLARPTPHKGLLDAIQLAGALGRPLWLVGPTGPALAALGAPGAASIDPSSPGPWPGEPGGPEVPVSCFGPLPRAQARAVLARGAALLALSRPDPDGRRAEGLGLACLEAAACGLPCVTGATGGLPEAAGPGLVLPASGPLGQAEINAVQVILDDATAGARARAWVQATHSPVAARAALAAARALAP
ncbi:MAG: glycosyltransferase [Deltaproteobacteria bacterium]|nr:glycosyltransferase [Deltaproteobacteria bacterium]